MGRIKSNWAKNVFLFVFLCLSAFCFSQQVELSYEPVWKEKSENSTPFFPLKILVTNKGDHVVGELSVTSEGSVIKIPAELPPQSRKSFVVYPEVGWDVDEHVIEFRTGLSTTKINYEIPTTWQEVQLIKAGVIANTEGELTFLRAKAIKEGPWDENIVWETQSVNPENAPTRSIGYQMFDVLVLGEGCERLSDDAVLAIKRYVQFGGQLIVFGGTPKPILNDERWGNFFPIKNYQSESVASLSALSRYGSALNQVSVSSYEPMNSLQSVSESGRLVRSWQWYGFGKVHFVAFDLLGGKTRQWDGRKGYFYSVIKNFPSVQSDYSTSIPDVLTQAQSYDNYYGYGGHTPSYNLPTFLDVETPGTGIVFAILMTYVIVVIPLNMWVLNKFRKGELYWLTAPIISLAFCFLFYQYASGLYKAGMSSRLSGVVLSSNGDESGTFAGMQELFIPKSGNHDLQLQGVEYCSSNLDGMTRSLQNEIAIYDVGEVIIPRYPTRSLTFNEFSMIQPLQDYQPPQAELSLRRLGSGHVVTGKITNGKSHKIKKVRIRIGPVIKEVVAELSQGEEKEVNIELPEFANYEGEFTRLTFIIDQLDAGSPIGSRIDDGLVEGVHSFTFEEGL